MAAAVNALEYEVAVHERPIDLVHLARMTLGDRSLEREVLQLFQRQATMLLERMQVVARPAVGALAHTLKGSARGIGAWRAARAAEAVELAASQSDAGFVAARRELADAVAEASGFITDMLRSS